MRGWKMKSTFVSIPVPFVFDGTFLRLIEVLVFDFFELDHFRDGSWNRSRGNVNAMQRRVGEIGVHA